MRKETLLHLTKEYDGPAEALGAYIRGHVETHNQFLVEAKKLAKAKAELRERHIREERDLNIEQKKLITRCPHYETTYWPDASGNNDSSTSCNLCGADL